MSRKERDRLKVLAQLEERKLTQKEAGRHLKLSERQVRRILKRYREEGDAGVIHKSRGKMSNNKIPGKTRGRAIKLIKERYEDFGPTLAMEYLENEDGIRVSHETVRRWMIEEDIWKPRKRRIKHRKKRERRAFWGELVQMDTSIHDWFEGRGEKVVLIAMIDDATSRLYARFYPTDSTAANMSLLRAYIKRNGRPLAIYADKASHFTTTRKTTLEEELKGLPAETQIERAFRELDIEYIPAQSPQAKGRVERLFGTLQDRLVKAMRLEGIRTIQEANEYLYRNFVPIWNRRFTVKPAGKVDVHRLKKGYDLDAIWSVQEKRVVANDYTIQYRNRVYQIERSSISGGLRKGKVLIENRLDRSIKIRFRGRYLKFHEVLHARPKVITDQNSKIPAWADMPDEPADQTSVVSL